MPRMTSLIKKLDKERPDEAVLVVECRATLRDNNPKKPERLPELDALRGIAAVAVMILFVILAVPVYVLLWIICCLHRWVDGLRMETGR